MTMTLLDFLSDEQPNVRATDPATSHDAAASIQTQLPTQRAQVLCLVAAHPEGVTAYEASHLLMRQQSVMSKRLSELHHSGLVEALPRTRRGGSGRKLTVYGITEHGMTIVFTLDTAGEA